tara:strand:- start:791 stop:1138 length:348 start_codon:yes stop_codon:yes gene_type:complete
MIKLTNILVENRYIGSCVDVGGSNAEICDIFPNASDMEVYVGNPDKGEEGKSKELSKEDWTQQIPDNRIKSKHIKGEHTFHYIAQDSIGRDMTPDESSLFFIYNVDQDIHYFYRK